MSCWIALSLILLGAVIFYTALHIWFVRGCRKIERQYQLEKKKIFNKYFLQEAEAIVNNYERRKAIFRPAVESDEDL